MSATWLITAHALRRYVERVRPGISFAQAAKDLERHCSGSHLVKMLPSGIESWRGPAPRRIRLRVRRNGNRLELVTVQPAFDGLRGRPEK
jgi:hypothetical protein